jgi:ABC-type Mn2+/Zn2+ transport system ATPase subunit
MARTFGARRLACMWRFPAAVRRFVDVRRIAHSSNFGKILSKEQQEYTSNYVSACAFEPPDVAHVSSAPPPRQRKVISS